MRVTLESHVNLYRVSHFWLAGNIDTKEEDVRCVGLFSALLIHVSLRQICERTLQLQ
jgi:hypothetical protein